MRKQQKQRTVIYISIVIVLLVAAYLTFGEKDNGSNFIQNIFNSTSANNKEIKALEPNVLSGSIFYISSDNVNSLSLASNQSTLINKSVNNTSPNLSSNGDFLFFNDNKLAIQHADGSTETINTDNQFNPLPSISPDGTKMAAVAFSNAERDFGYKLQVFGTDGNYISNPATSQSNITHVGWLSNDTLAYTVIGTSSSQIWSVKTDGSESSQLVNENKKYIIDMAASSQTIAYSLSSSQDSSANLGIYILINGETRAVSNTTGTKSLQVSNSGKYVTFIDADDISVIYNRQTGEKQKLDISTQKIIGWIND